MIILGGVPPKMVAVLWGLLFKTKEGYPQNKRDPSQAFPSKGVVWGWCGRYSEGASQDPTFYIVGNQGTA